MEYTKISLTDASCLGVNTHAQIQFQQLFALQQKLRAADGNTHVCLWLSIEIDAPYLEG